MQYIKIDNDMWHDHGKVWEIIQANFRPGSSAVDLVIEDTETKEVIKRVVPLNQIEWLESKDW